jgi:signal peptidase I
VHFLFPLDASSPDSGEGSFDLRRTYGPAMVPDGEYFMMGDNRDNSQDSRYWGFLRRDYVKGKALFVYFSFGEEGSGLPLLGNVRWSRILHQIH